MEEQKINMPLLGDDFPRNGCSNNTRKDEFTR